MKQPLTLKVPITNQGRISQRKERDGLCFSFAVPKVQWDSHPVAPMALGKLYPLHYHKKSLQWQNLTFHMPQFSFYEATII